MIKFNNQVLVKCENCGTEYHVSHKDLSYNLYVEESDSFGREHFFSGDIDCPHCYHSNDLGISIFESTGFTIDVISTSSNIIKQPNVDIVPESNDIDIQLTNPIEYI